MSGYRTTTSVIVDRLESLGATIRESAAIGAILAVAFGLRAQRLSGDGLWVGETERVLVATGSPGASIAALPANSFVESPLYVVALGGWLAGFGETPLAARSLSVLFGTATIYVIYGIGRRLFDRRVGLLAALLLAVSPLHVQYAREVGPNALLFLLGTLSFYFFARLLTGDGSWAIVAGYILATASLAAASVLALTVLVVQGGVVARWVLPPGWPTRLDLRTWGLALSATAGGSALVIGLAAWANPSLGVPYGTGFVRPDLDQLSLTATMHAGALRSYPFDATGGRTLWLSLVVLVLCLPLAWRSFVGFDPDTAETGHPEEINRSARFRTYLQREYLLLSWLLGPVLLLAIGSHLIEPIFAVNHTIVSSGALVLLVAHGVTRVRRRHLRWLAAAALVLGLLGSTGVYLTADSREDWPGAAAAVDGDEDAPVFVTPGFVDRSLGYYADRPGESVVRVPETVTDDAADPLVHPDETAAATLALLDTAPGGPDRVWVVSPRTYDRSAAWLVDVHESLELLRYEEYGAVEVYYFAVPDELTETAPDGNDTAGRVAEPTRNYERAGPPRNAVGDSTSVVPMVPDR